MDLIKKSNRTKSEVSLSRLAEVKRYFLSMYRCYAVQMYDKGYIDDPTRFNDKMLRNNLTDMGITEMVTNNGRVNLTSSQAMFALCKNKNHPDRVEYLTILHDMLKYREYAQTVDRVYSEFFKESLVGNIKASLIPKGAMITQRSGINFDLAFARCVSSFNEDTKYISINDDIWNIAMEILGIPEDEWHSDGIFDSDLSHEDEKLCMEGILNGKFPARGGKYLDRLEKWLQAESTSTVRMKTELHGLYNSLYTEKVSVISNILEKCIKQIEEMEGKTKILAIEKDKVYYNVDRTTYTMPFGIFSLVCSVGGSEYLLPDGNTLNGYTGELYSEKCLIEDEIDYLGCPVVMNVSKDDTEFFYDLEQTCIKSDSWFLSNKDVDIEFVEDVGISNDMKKGTLAYEIYEGYINSLKDSSNLIHTVNVSTYAELESAKKKLFKRIGD